MDIEQIQLLSVFRIHIYKIVFIISTERPTIIIYVNYTVPIHNSF